MRSQDDQIDTASDFSSDFASSELSSLADNQLDAVSGGMRMIDVFMPYNNFIVWPGGNYSPTRLC